MRKSSIQQYQQFQEYTNYIDTSDVMLGFYKDQTGTGLEKYYLMIEEWLSIQQDQNKPLVIQAQGGVGKKALLVKWFEYHQSLNTHRKKDLILLHFATTGGNNSNYFYAIYRILIKLRQQLNIGQKVELHQQKLRKYFSYWLDVCNQKIQTQIIQNAETIYDKIILVFEGIDYFTDRTTGKQGNIAFWLPKFFPKNVKVIVTAQKQSESMRYFNNLGCQKVIIPPDINIVKTMIKWQQDKQLCAKGEIKDKLLDALNENLKQNQLTSLYVKTYLSCFLPQKISEVQISAESSKKIQNNLQKVNIKRIRQLINIDCLFDYILQFWGKCMFQSEQKFIELIGLLISTQKGLTKFELLSITKLTSQQLKVFFTVFRIFLMNFKDLWMIKNDSFKRAINQKYNFKVNQISEKIAEVLKKTPNSVRKLQEETFQLYCSGNYFKLKQVISDIENFLLLFNPYTKYDLCRYWQKLQEKSFDPVIEYNKAIEGFEMHYHPTSDDLFRIITQISRFLKQFADFQTYYTPQFRHPYLIGNSKELDDIGILGQFKNLNLFQQQQENNTTNEKTEENDQENTNQVDEEKRLKKKIKDMYEKIQKGKHIKKNNNQVEPPNTKNAPQVKNQKKKKNKIVPIQQLNVEVKSNQQRFRSYYYQQIQPFLKKVSLQGQQQNFVNITNEQEDSDSSQNEQNQKQTLLALKIKKMEKEKEKSKFQDMPDLKELYAKTVQEQFELNQKPPTYYYYKRWIWMQFPWVCMTMKCDYSDKLKKCFTSPTSYMSVSQERQFTLQALKIALQAKKKKQAILQKSQDSQISSVRKPLNNNTSVSTINALNPVNTSKGSNIKEANKTFMKKQEDFGYVTNSFLKMDALTKLINQIPTDQLQKNSIYEEKNSVFLTSNEANSTILNSFSKNKKKKLATEQLNLTANSRKGMLPRIKQSVNHEMMRQLESLEKNNAQMRKQVDAYQYKNKILAKKLKQLKIIQYNNASQVKTAKKIDQTKKKIEQIQNKLQKVKQQYAYSLLQHERLNVLIKICQKNKTHNQEVIPELITQCNNFKKMIKIESQAIFKSKEKTKEIKKINKKLLNIFMNKIQNQKNLSEVIKATIQNRENFQEEIQKYGELIVDQIEQKRKELNEQIKNSRIEQESTTVLEKTKKITEDDDDYQAIYNELKQYLNLEDQNYREDQKYISLMEGLAKKRQLQVIIEQRKTQLQQLQRKYQQEKRQIQTLQKAKAQNILPTTQQERDPNEYEFKIDPQQLQKLDREMQQKQRTLKKITDIKLSCLGMLNSWYTRLGLPQQNELTITNEFLERLQQAKVMSQVQSF